MLLCLFCWGNNMASNNKYHVWKRITTRPNGDAEIYIAASTSHPSDYSMSSGGSVVFESLGVFHSWGDAVVCIEENRKGK